MIKVNNKKEYFIVVGNKLHAENLSLSDAKTSVGELVDDGEDFDNIMVIKGKTVEFSTGVKFEDEEDEEDEE